MKLAEVHFPRSYDSTIKITTAIESMESTRTMEIIAVGYQGIDCAIKEFQWYFNDILVPLSISAQKFGSSSV